jgi:hypothetical protein
VWGLGFVRVRTRGTPASTEDAGVIVSNHMGLVESAYLVGIYGASVVTTRENARVPFIGSIVRGMRCMTVDRAAGSGLEAIRSRVTQVTQSANTNQLLMFPEGGWVRMVCFVGVVFGIRRMVMCVYFFQFQARPQTKQQCLASSGGRLWPDDLCSPWPVG